MPPPCIDSRPVLYHVSEQAEIARFEPRVVSTAEQPVVWAVSPERLCNYLLPRDCPRVTFFAGEKTTSADRERFLGSSQAVVAFQSDWLDRVRKARLYCYRLPGEGFKCVDACAGYFQSTEGVIPEGTQVVEDCLSALVLRGVEVRIVGALWPLRDAIVTSTLSYSMIRMRNASPRLSM